MNPALTTKMQRTEPSTDRIVRKSADLPQRPARRYILCVDDEQSVLNQLIHQLTRRFGKTHRVEGAESGEEALHLIDELGHEGGRVEMIICDQIMPGMRGDHLLEVINRKHPEMIRILLTGQAGLDSAVYAINNAGLHKYIEKPWDVEDLCLTIQNLLTQYSLNQEIKEYHRELERKTASLRSLQSLGVKLATAESIETMLPPAMECARKISPGCSIGMFVSGSALRTNVNAWTFTTGLTIDAPTRQEIVARLFEQESSEAPHLPFFEIPAGVQLEGRGKDARVDCRIVVLPMRTKDRLYGALACVVEGRPELTTSEIELLTILTTQLSITIENRLLLEHRIRSEKLTAIGQMVSVITHDYRTPMTVIKGYAEMLEGDEVPFEEAKKYGSMINREVDRMEHMIEDLLEFVRGAKGEPKLAPHNLQTLFEEVHRDFEPQLRASGVTVQLSFPEPGAIRGDADKLKRAFANLLRNAIDAMPKGGTVRVEMSVGGNTYRVDVADSGVGIPKEHLPRVFEPFFTKGKRKGMGLGTSIARSIVEEHGGAITVTSEPGQGTTFTMTFPRFMP